MITGRPLDETGTPTDGPALEVDPEGRAMQLFSNSPHPLASSPGMGMWATILSYPEPNEGEAPTMLVWLGPEATELPAHVHASRPELFRAVEGELTVVVDGEPTRLAPTEEFTVDSGDPHYFRNDTDEFVAFYVEVPWTRTIDTQYMSFGLDHEGNSDSDESYGEPGPVQGLLLAEYVREETTITVVPSVVQRILWGSIGRIAKLLGRTAVDETYLEDQFWEAHVEQPDI